MVIIFVVILLSDIFLFVIFLSVIFFIFFIFSLPLDTGRLVVKKIWIITKSLMNLILSKWEKLSLKKKDKIEKKTMKIIQNKKIFTLNYLRPAKSKVKYSFLNVWNWMKNYYNFVTLNTFYTEAPLANYVCTRTYNAL